MTPASGTWSTQQLTEFLAVVSSVPEAAAAVREAIERAAEALEAELGAVISDGAVTASVGFRGGHGPQAELFEVAHAGADAVELPGIGPCRTAVVPLEGSTPGRLVLARLGDEAFTREDVNLLRGCRASLRACCACCACSTRSARCVPAASARPPTTPTCSPRWRSADSSWSSSPSCKVLVENTAE